MENNMPIDKMNPNAAASAYANAFKVGKMPGIDAGATDKMTFGQYVDKAARDSVETMRHGEKIQADAVMGKADLTDVVQAVTSAELTLQTVVGLRDRMLSAYQEIMRMPI
jgi:flagellar hook-basal body complex protein FliE